MSGRHQKRRTSFRVAESLELRVLLSASEQGDVLSPPIENTLVLDDDGSAPASIQPDGHLENLSAMPQELQDTIAPQPVPEVAPPMPYEESLELWSGDNPSPEPLDGSSTAPMDSESMPVSEDATLTDPLLTDQSFDSSFTSEELQTEADLWTPDMLQPPGETTSEEVMELQTEAEMWTPDTYQPFEQAAFEDVTKLSSDTWHVLETLPTDPDSWNPNMYQPPEEPAVEEVMVLSADYWAFLEEMQTLRENWTFNPYQPPEKPAVEEVTALPCQYSGFWEELLTEAEMWTPDVCQPFEEPAFEQVTYPLSESWYWWEEVPTEADSWTPDIYPPPAETTSDVVTDLSIDSSFSSEELLTGADSQTPDIYPPPAETTPDVVTDLSIDSSFSSEEVPTEADSQTPDIYPPFEDATYKNATPLTVDPGLADLMPGATEYFDQAIESTLVVGEASADDVVPVNSEVIVFGDDALENSKAEISSTDGTEDWIAFLASVDTSMPHLIVPTIQIEATAEPLPTVVDASADEPSNTDQSSASLVPPDSLLALAPATAVSPTESEPTEIHVDFQDLLQALQQEPELAVSVQLEGTVLANESESRSLSTIDGQLDVPAVAKSEPMSLPASESSLFSAISSGPETVVVSTFAGNAVAVTESATLPILDTKPGTEVNPFSVPVYVSPTDLSWTTNDLWIPLTSLAVQAIDSNTSANKSTVTKGQDSGTTSLNESETSNAAQSSSSGDIEPIPMTTLGTLVDPTIESLE